MTSLFLFQKSVCRKHLNIYLSVFINSVCVQAILGLFFQLSRYKQQQKQSQPVANSGIPTSPAKYGISSIPGSDLTSKFLVSLKELKTTNWYKLKLCVGTKCHHSIKFLFLVPGAGTQQNSPKKSNSGISQYQGIRNSATRNTGKIKGW